jgi:Spy/CpxP family protein refolding chaperone
MKPIRRITLAAAVVGATIVLVTPATAQADNATGADFGQHVLICAQTMGFTGEHNPGMHQGYAGWDGMTCDM